MTQGGSRRAGSMTWAFVTRKPRPSTNQAVPVSMKGLGVTVTGPRPQLIVTSARTSALTSATAGLARRSASWTDRAAAGEGTTARPALAISTRIQGAFDARTVTGSALVMLPPSSRPAVQSLGRPPRPARRRRGDPRRLAPDGPSADPGAPPGALRGARR